MSVRIRFADPERDASRILAVYAPYIGRTAITFETEVPDGAAFAARIAGIARDFPYLLLEIDGELAGYAYAHRQAERAAYQWNAELSIYLAEGFVHRGLGGPLYALLMRLLGMQGYVNLYACITVSNAGSIALHERMGFARVGEFPASGYKLGQWHGVVWLCRRLGDGAPGAVCPVGALDAEAVRAAVLQAENEISARLSSKRP